MILLVRTSDHNGTIRSAQNRVIPLIRLRVLLCITSEQLAQISPIRLAPSPDERAHGICRPAFDAQAVQIQRQPPPVNQIRSCRRARKHFAARPCFCRHWISSGLSRQRSFRERLQRTRRPGVHAAVSARCTGEDQNPAARPQLSHIKAPDCGTQQELSAEQLHLATERTAKSFLHPQLLLFLLLMVSWHDLHAIFI